MVETKLFKTKLCVLYQTGRCDRQTCTFAHGNAELRQSSSSFPERRSHRGDDLRTKLDRKRSPEIKYFPGRDARGSHSFRRFSPAPPHKRRKYRAHFDMDGQNDVQMTFRSQDGTPEHYKDKKFVASDFRISLPDEQKQVQHEVDVLLDQKSLLKGELKERAQEADSLSSRIRDLEAQLSEEKDKFKRVNSKIKTFIGAHLHHSRLQDQMKRSQLQLEQLVEEFGSDAIQIDPNEDYLNVNIISDEEIQELKDRATPRKRSLPNRTEVPQGYKSGHRVDVDGFMKRSSVLLDGNKDAEMDNNREDTPRPSRESKSRRRNASRTYISSDKVSESHLASAPPTSMAAHAVDDFVELTEEDENLESVEFATSNRSGMTFPLPPLPSMTHDNYLQNEGDDESVNVDGLDVEC